MQLVDTHCHIHSLDYPLDRELVYSNAISDGLIGLVCVGTDLEDSLRACIFTSDHQKTWASIGIHPHMADKYHCDNKTTNKFEELLSKDKVVAIGECGLDYFYNNSSKIAQKEILRMQIRLAQKNNLPIIFHVRSAFDDFWPIVDEFSFRNGVIHSFSDSLHNMDQAIKRDFYLGVNGIATFTKNQEQIKMYKSVPLSNLVLETDSPFLTPSPLRGTICEPKYISITAKFLADLRSESLELIIKKTFKNSQKLFNF